MGTSLQFGLRMGCDMGQYDEFASLFFARREWCVKKMVTQAAPHEPYTVFSMSVAAMVYLVLLIFTFGAPLPAGLFMPCIVIGSCVGRCVGQLVKEYVSSKVRQGADRDCLTCRLLRLLTSCSLIPPALCRYLQGHMPSQARLRCWGEYKARQSR